MNKECKHEILKLKKEEVRACGWTRKQYFCESCGFIINTSVKGDYWFPIPDAD